MPAYTNDDLEYFRKKTTQENMPSQLGRASENFGAYLYGNSNPYAPTVARGRGVSDAARDANTDAIRNAYAASRTAKFTANAIPVGGAISEFVDEAPNYKGATTGSLRALSTGLSAVPHPGFSVGVPLAKGLSNAIVGGTIDDKKYETHKYFDNPMGNTLAKGVDFWTSQMIPGARSFKQWTKLGAENDPGSAYTDRNNQIEKWKSKNPTQSAVPSGMVSAYNSPMPNYSKGGYVCARTTRGK